MVTEASTHVIDAEFAFVGPVAFDVGKMVANLLIAYFASPGLESGGAPRGRQRAWLLQARMGTPVGCLQPQSNAACALVHACTPVACYPTGRSYKQPFQARA